MATVTAGTKFMGVSSSTDTTERKSTSLNDNTEVVTIEDIIQTVTGDSEGYAQTIVNISPSETTYSDGRPTVASGILAMGTTPIELLPTADTNKYYEIDKIILEYTHVTTPYTHTGFLMFADGDNYKGLFVIDSWATNGFLRFTGDTSEINVTETNNITYFTNISSFLRMEAWSGGSPTLGDGTIRAIIKYKVRTFGA